MVCWSQPPIQDKFKAGSLQAASEQWKIHELGRFPDTVLQDGVPVPFTQPCEQFEINNRPLSKYQYDFVASEISELLESGVITKLDVKPSGVSPIGSVPKKGGKQRLIVDLRHLNKHCETPKFQYEDINTVLSLAKYGDNIVTLDLKNGFHHVPVSAKDQTWLGFKFNGHYYQYGYLPFGANFSPYYFSKILRPVIAHLRLKGLRLAVYVDDIILFAAEEDIDRHSQILVQTLQKLGWCINFEKSNLTPSTSKTFLGYRIITDGPNNSVWLKVCTDKVQKLKHDIRRLLTAGSGTARVIARITGKCIAMAKAIMPAKLLLRNLYRLLATRTGWDSRLTLDDPSIADLHWWLEALVHWNGRAVSNRQVSSQIYTDASQTGWGGWMGTAEASGHWNHRMSRQHSNVREMMAVLLTLHCFRKHIQGKKVQVLTDNVSCVAYINHLGGPSTQLTQVAQAIWDLAYQTDTELIARHLSGVTNQRADSLSRIGEQYEWSLNQGLFNYLEAKWGPHTIDRFANLHNTKLPLYNSRFLDPRTQGVDALSQNNWGIHNNYVNPPFRMIPEVLQVVIQQKAVATLIAPAWRAQPWFQVLQKLSIAPPMKLPRQGTVIQSTPQSCPEPGKNPRWRLYAWRINGKNGSMPSDGLKEL